MIFFLYILSLKKVGMKGTEKLIEIEGLLENLMNGVSKEEIRAELQKFEEQAPDLCADFDNFVQVVQKYGFVKLNKDKKPLDINWNFAEEDNYKLLIWEFSKDKTNELVKQK